MENINSQTRLIHEAVSNENGVDAGIQTPIEIKLKKDDDREAEIQKLLLQDRK